MAATTSWSLYELKPLTELLGNVILDRGEIFRCVERAGCESPGKIKQNDVPEQQWEEVISFAIKNGFVEQLILDVQPHLPGDTREEFRNRLRMAGARRIVRMLGPDYSKLWNDIGMLLEEQEPNRLLEATAAIRKIALDLRKELDDDLSWQTFTPISTSNAEIRQTRERLVLICLNIVTAADYMLAVVKPLCAAETTPDSKVERIHLAVRGNTGNNASSEDEQLRRMLDARMTLALEARRLWRSIKESVTLAPSS